MEAARRRRTPGGRTFDQVVSGRGFGATPRQRGPQVGGVTYDFIN